MPARYGVVALDLVLGLRPRRILASSCSSGLWVWLMSCDDGGIAGGGVDAAVAEQYLNDPDVGAVLQQVRGEAMAPMPHAA